MFVFAPGGVHSTIKIDIALAVKQDGLRTLWNAKTSNDKAVRHFPPCSDRHIVNADPRLENTGIRQ